MQVHLELASDSLCFSCIDSGAKPTVTGRKQAEAHFPQIGDKEALSKVYMKMVSDSDRAT